MKLNRKQWLIIIMLAGLLLCSVLIEISLSKVISESNLAIRLQAPSMHHFFGTDAFGRDVFVRTIAAANISILSAIVIVLVAGGFGIFVGMVSGYTGGFLDEVLMGICDLFLAFPQMLIAIAIAGILGGGLHNAMIALAIRMLFARLARSATLKEKSELYVTAARFAGLSDIEILLNHILPNIRNLLIVTLTLNFANMLLSLAGLSFLGIGVKVPTPEWGSMISEGRQYLASAPWISLFPCLSIFITVFLINQFGKTFSYQEGKQNETID